MSIEITSPISPLKRIIRWSKDDLLLNLASFALLLMLIIGPLLFLFSRVYLFQATYAELVQERDNNEWLVGQCQRDDFYHNMKHHSTLCDEVEQQQRQSVLMKAMSRVVEKTYLCGYQSCSVTIESFLLWASKDGFWIIVVFVIGFVVLPAYALPMVRRRFNKIADDRLFALHHAPYGHNHYVTNTPLPYPNYHLHTFE